MSGSESTSTSVLEDFRKILIIQNSQENTVITPTANLKNFNPPNINLMDLPSESGTFQVKPVNGNFTIFAGGKYSVTNCIIDEDDEIIEETYDWIVTTESTCKLEIINVKVSDNTACDYYYSPSDIYTPVNQIPSEQVTSSEITINYPPLLSAITYFNLLTRTQPRFIPGLFYVKLSNEQSGNEVCVLNTIFGPSFVLNAGQSLSNLQSIPQEDRTNSNTNQLLLLQWVASAAQTALYSQSTGSILTLQNGGLIETITLPNGNDYGLYLTRAKSEVNLIEQSGAIELLFVLVRQTEADNPYDGKLFT